MNLSNEGKGVIYVLLYGLAGYFGIEIMNADFSAAIQLVGAIAILCGAMMTLIEKEEKKSEE